MNCHAEAPSVNVSMSPPALSSELLLTATEDVRAAGVPYDFAVTPACLPGAMYHAMQATWLAFREGVEALIDKNGGDLRRTAAALSLPAHLTAVWEAFPPHDWAMIARPDMIIAQDMPRIVDVNAGSLAGHFAINDMLLRAHRTPGLRPLFAGAGEPRFVMGHYADVLRRFLAHPDDVIAVSYFAEEDAAGPSSARFHYQAEIDELGRLGLPARMAHVEDLEVATGGVYCGADRIGLIHRYFLLDHDDPDQMGHAARIAAAARAGLTVIWTGLQGEIFESKTTIAVLSDERFTSGLTPSLAASLGSAVPWTRSVEERHTFWRDTKVDLLPWVVRNQALLVLKPAIGGMGESVTIGREISPPAWEAQLNTALADAKPWVVQELLTADTLEFALADSTGAIHVEQGPAVYGAFVLDSEFIGAICRYGRQGHSGLMINGLTGAVPAPVYWSGG